MDPIVAFDPLLVEPFHDEDPGLLQILYVDLARPSLGLWPSRLEPLCELENQRLLSFARVSFKDQRCSVLLTN